MFWYPKNRVFSTCVSLSLGEVPSSLYYFLFICLTVTVSSVSVIQIRMYESVRCLLHVRRLFNSPWRVCGQSAKGWGLLVSLHIHHPAGFLLIELGLANNSAYHSGWSSGRNRWIGPPKSVPISRPDLLLWIWLRGETQQLSIINIPLYIYGRNENIIYFN